MFVSRLTLGAAVLVAITLTACSDESGSKITAQSTRTASAASRHSEGAAHAMLGNDDLNWGPAPNVLPAGAQIAVVQGDPGAAGKIFTLRLRFPNGYVLKPHTHPEEEHVTVLTGTFLAGMGADFSNDGLVSLQAGGFMTMPKDAPHFARTVGITEVQVHGIGPFQLTYVHPEDDPRNQ
jgi:quercetin dioxygenase-like cupin family protein